MRKCFYYVALGVSMLASPALAQSSGDDPRYENDNGPSSRDIERQIDRLEAQIDAADRAGRISGSQADSLARELRNLESRLDDIRERSASGNGDWNTPRSDRNDGEGDRREDQDNGLENRDSSNPDPNENRDDTGGSVDRS